MKTFKDFLYEGVSDINSIKKKSLNMRTAKDITALKAHSQKPKSGKVVVHVKLDNGKTAKETFKLTSRDWDSEAEKTANAFFNQLKSISEKAPDSVKPIEIVKYEIK